MRYEVNQKLFAINFSYPGNFNYGLYTQPLLNNDIAPSEINFIELQVTEHHKVPNSWGNVNDKDCDGYLLKDADGNPFVNQYPTASYGQTTDTGDRRFRRRIELEEQLVKGGPYEYHLLSDVLSEFYKGIDDLGKHGTALAMELRGKLEKLRDRIEEDFVLKYPGMVVVANNEPLIEGSDILHWEISFYQNPV